MRFLPSLEIHISKIAPFKILRNILQYCSKVLPNMFHFNGHTIGFRPQTRKLGHCIKQIVPCESAAEELSFEW